MAKFLRAAAVSAAVSASLLSVPAIAGTHTYFKDRTITIVVPSGSGGTFHIYCQIVVQSLGRHIPSKPKLITQNRPGAGGVKSLRWMVSAAPKDGSVIAMINPGTTMSPVLRPKMGYDATKLQWLGAPSVRTYTLGVWYKTPIKTIEDAKKQVVTLASTGKAATSTTLPQLLNKHIGTKFKVITGDKGGGAMNLAVERGETWGRTNYYSGYLGVRPDWIRDKKITFLATIGPPRPEVKDIPRVRDLVKPGMERAMVDLLESNFNVGQAFYVPPGVPKARVAMLRKAFTAMLKDPAFHALGKKPRVPTITRTWQQVEAAVKVGYGSPPDVAEKLATLLGFRKEKK